MEGVSHSECRINQTDQLSDKLHFWRSMSSEAITAAWRVFGDFAVLGRLVVPAGYFSACIDGNDYSRGASASRQCGCSIFAYRPRSNRQQ